MSVTYTPVYTQTVSGTPGTVTFNNIPQSYTDILIKISARSNINATSSEMYIFQNADGGANYSTTILSGNGSSVSSSRGANNGAVITIQVNGATSTANTFGSIEVYVPNYTQTNLKQILVDSVAENNATASDIKLISYLYRSTLPTTSISFTAVGGSFVANSTFSLYGVTRFGA